jgi:ABC-type multidrug transport system ATPase subunit
MNDSDTVIKVKNLNKSFRRFKAVSDLDLNVKAGSVHGFLGPNGAGKTTVIRVLLGLITPNTAEIEIFGKDLFRYRNTIMRSVGAIVEAPVFFNYFTAFENLKYITRCTSMVSNNKIHEMLERVGLSHAANKKVGAFSYGMKQRLGIAQALLPQSRLIFLDEPTNGLDPHGIMGVRRLMRTLRDDLGITIFISSHLLSEVEQTCDYVTIIDEGKKICEESVALLVNQNKHIEIKTSDKEKFKDFATSSGIKINKFDDSNGAAGLFIIDGEEKDIPGLAEKMVKAGISINKISKHENSLEEIFVSLTQTDKANLASDRF